MGRKLDLTIAVCDACPYLRSSEWYGTLEFCNHPDVCHIEDLKTGPERDVVMRDLKVNASVAIPEWCPLPLVKDTKGQSMEQQQLDQRLGDVIDLNAHVFSMTTRDIQRDIGKWARYNFGVTENSHFEKEQLAKMLVLIQLLGEAAHALLKSTQGIRGNNTEHQQKWNDTMQFIGQVSTSTLSDNEITQVLYQVPDNFKVAPLLGVVEEAGEMVTAVMDMNRPADVEDAIGDLQVFLLHLCDVLGYDADSALKGVWSKVRQRDWKKNKENGK